METAPELTIKLVQEELEGGYARNTSEGPPDFRVLCEPEEIPFQYLRDIIPIFILPLLRVTMKDKLVLKRLRIIPTGKTLFKDRPASTIMEADLARLGP